MASLKLKSLPVFPTKVRGAGGIGVGKSNGVYTIEPEWDDLALALSISANNMHVWVRDATDGTYKRVALSTLIASITAPIFVQDDAPSAGETEGSIWIDADSTDADVYQLVSGVWTDTTANLKGPQGETGSAGADGSLIFVQDDAPDTSEPDGSIWIDSNSTDNDLYQLSSGSWVDTGVNLKGADGLGTGDFVGPASSTSGNVVSFGDNTGKLGADSGIAASDILVESDIGTTVQGYDADTTKNDVANTFTAKQTFNDFIVLKRGLESVNIIADNPASGDNNIDVLTSLIHYFTSNTDTDWDINLRGDSSTSLDSLMATGQAITVAIIVTNGATPYKHGSLKIDGNAVTPHWAGSPAPTAGTASKRDTYTFTAIKTGSATFIVQATFAGGN